MDRFRRSILFCQLEFDKEAVYDGFMAHFLVLREGSAFHSPISLFFLLINVYVLYDFATLNFIRNPFLMVSWHIYLFFWGKVLNYKLFQRTQLPWTLRTLFQSNTEPNLSQGVHDFSNKHSTDNQLFDCKAFVWKPLL